MPPAGTAAQVPLAPGNAQEKQLAVHAVAQQTPCSQWPVAHSSSLPHNNPLLFFPQDPLAQMLGVWQSPFDPQLEAQRLPLHL